MLLRRQIRAGPKVIHKHRVGQRVFRRVSELVYIGGRPRALLGWISTAGGLRAPLYICDLDPSKLRKASGTRNTFYYDLETVDPRYEEIELAEREK